MTIIIIIITTVVGSRWDVCRSLSGEQNDSGTQNGFRRGFVISQTNDFVEGSIELSSDPSLYSLLSHAVSENGNQTGRFPLENSSLTPKGNALQSLALCVGHRYTFKMFRRKNLSDIYRRSGFQVDNFFSLNGHMITSILVKIRSTRNS